MNVERLFSMVAVLATLCLCSPAFSAGFAGLGDRAEGFAPVTKRPLVFPEDFGAHPGFRIEWWYLTCNLKDASGASYGVQWTLFRHASDPEPAREGWADRTFWMGHAAVTTASEHLFAETRARGGVGQAGVIAQPFQAWIDDWRLASSSEAPGAGLSRLTVSASGAGFRYDLRLETKTPLVLHGDEGLSRKSEQGLASYYYSQPFFEVEGVLLVHDREVKVSGKAWVDREWSSQPLAPDQKGWDWLSLHFSGGEKLMLYRLRSEKSRPYYAGTWIAADGTPQPLTGDDVILEPLSISPVAGRELPTKWRLRVKSRSLDIETSPLNANSFMATSFQYWEGPISLQGSHRGEGYLEMTGY